MPDLFSPRDSFKPFEYPTVERFKDSIQRSYWLVNEWSFQSDVQDFRVNLSLEEREAVRRTLLAISQIEVAVKRFWTKVGDWIPKPEVEQVCGVFSESEVRHCDAYSHLLQVLGLNQDFSRLSEVPAIQKRIEYLGRPTSDGWESRVLNLVLFTLFTENVSLFSQFALVKSLNKNRNVLKDIDNVIQATMKEELVHALFGVWLINEIKEQSPHLFTEELWAEVRKRCQKAYEAECSILDWIFESGDIDSVSRESLKELIKSRFNEGLSLIGADSAFEIDADALAPLRWFEEEIYAQTETDFFYKRPVSYDKRSQSITAEDLF